jgi:putative MATE family efflux protein
MHVENSNTSSKPVTPTISPRTQMILNGPIVPTLLRLATPNILNLLAFVGLITFDGLFVGKLGPDALAGISLVFPFVMLMQHGAASGMGGAVLSAVARAIGAGDMVRANNLTAHAFMLAVILTLIFSSIMLVGGPMIFRAMGGQGAVLEAAMAYSNVAFTGLISIWMLNLLGNVVRGTGNMGLPALVIVLSVLGHIILSPMLIFGIGPVPAFGASGAALGLVTSFGLGSLFLIFYLRSGRSLVKLSFKALVPQGALFAEFFKIGVPGKFNVAINNLTVIILTGIAGSLGRDAAIGYAMGARLEYIIIPLGFGIGTGIVAMVGTNWGAGQKDRARAIAWTGSLVVAAVCGSVGLFFALFPQIWMQIFTTDENIIAIGSNYLRWVGPVYLLYGLGMGLYFACQGYGRLVLAVVANLIRLLISAGGALLAIQHFGLGTSGVFAASALGFVAYAAFTCFALKRVYVARQRASKV